MNYDTTITPGLTIGGMAAIVAAVKRVQFWRAFLVLEGCAGLLCCQDKNGKAGAPDHRAKDEAG